MQFLIDTQNDSPAEMRAAALMILETVKIRTEPTTPVSSAPPAPPKPLAFVVDSAAPSLQLVPDENGDDVEVEIDSDGNVTALATKVELPAAPPPPPPPPPAKDAAALLPPATPAPPGPAVPAEFDKLGMPWDGRIHASNRAKKIDGAWKNKRGVSQDLVAACEAQNKPGNAPMPTTAMPATASAAPHATTAGPAPAASSAPTAPPPPVPTAGVAVPAAAAPSAIDFRGLMQKIQKATAEGKLTADQVNAALAGVGLKPEEMAALINNAPLIASVNAAVEKCFV